MKADFQKVIGEIRNDIGGMFPKAMMTNQQMQKNTATVNCGGEWRSAENAMKTVNAVMNDERFKAFLVRQNATAMIEYTQFATPQIRINY